MKKYSALVAGLLVLVVIATIDARIASPKRSSSAPSSITVEKKALTKEEVALHNTDASCYTIVSGKAYDLTTWIKQHPGGARAILGLCGKDGTTAFEKQHGSSQKAQTALTSFYIGDLR